MGCTVDWAWFVIEAEPGATGLPEARNQAQRDCGAILNALLKLKEYVQGKFILKKTGAVEDFWVFPLCWQPDYAQFNVHWVEIQQNDVKIFHTTKLMQKFMDEDEHQAEIRACGHNIFDYGLLEHVPKMEKLWAQAIQNGKPYDDDFDVNT